MLVLMLESLSEAPVEIRQFAPVTVSHDLGKSQLPKQLEYLFIINLHSGLDYPFCVFVGV